MSPSLQQKERRKSNKIIRPSYGIYGQWFNVTLERDPIVYHSYWMGSLGASGFSASYVTVFYWNPPLYILFDFKRQFWLWSYLQFNKYTLSYMLRQDAKYAYISNTVLINAYDPDKFMEGKFWLMRSTLGFHEKDVRLNFYQPLAGNLQYSHVYSHHPTLQPTLTIHCKLLTDTATPPSYVTVHFSDDTVVEKEVTTIYESKVWFSVMRKDVPEGRLRYTVTVQDIEHVGEPDTYTDELFIIHRLEDVKLLFTQVTEDRLLHQSPFLVNIPLNLTIVPIGTAEVVELYVDGVQYPVTRMNMSSVILQFDEIGSHSLMCSVGNVYGNTTSSATISIVKPISNLILLSSSPAFPKSEIFFFLFVEDAGYKTVFSLDFGDNTPPLYFSWPTVDAELDGFDIPLLYDFSLFRKTLFTHVYKTEGKYNATLAGQSPISAATSIADVVVQTAACPAPVVHVWDGVELATVNRFMEITLTSKITAECTNRKAVLTQWKAYQLEDASAIPSASNQHALNSSIDVTSSVLIIPPFNLEYGSYVFKLIVSVINSIDVGTQNSDVACINVVPSQLVPKIAGGSARTVGWNQTIVFDGQGSRDPDNIHPHEGVIFQWYCRQYNETFPEDPSLEELSGKGGCLDNGLYLGNTSVLQLPHAALRGNRSYVFRLSLSKHGRESVYTDQTLTVLPGEPPNVELRCLRNCEAEVNPSEKLVLSGRCTDCTFYTRPKYWWTFKSKEDNVKQDIDWKTEATTKRNNAYLSIKANTFLNSYADEFTFRLTVVSWSGAVAYAEYTFTVNEPPSLGRCLTSPTEGVVLQTKFTISCTGFSDVNTPLKYEFRAVTGEEHIAPDSEGLSRAGTLLYYGLDSMASDLLLPLGMASQNYLLGIHVNVFDSNGAGAYAHVNVTVNPKEVSSDMSVEDTVLSLTTGSDSELDKLLETGDSQSVLQFIGTVTSLLNTEARKEAHTEHHHGSDVTGDQTPISNELHDDEQEHKLNQRVQIREAILSSLATEEVKSLDGIQQQSAAISQITQEESEVSVDAQTLASTALKTMAHFLKDQSVQGVSSETIEQTSSSMVAAVDHVLDAMYLKAKENTTLGSDSDVDDHAQKDRNVSSNVFETLNDVMDAILVNKVPGEKASVMESHSMSMLLSRQEMLDIGGTTLSSGNNIKIQLPPSDKMFHSFDVETMFDTVVDTKVQHFKNNPFHWSKNSSQVTSTVSRLEFTKDGAGIAVTNLTEPVKMLLPHRSGSSFTPDTIDTMVNSANLTFMNVSMDDPEAALFFEVHSHDSTVGNHEIYLSYEAEPSQRDYDFHVRFPRDVNYTDSDDWNASTSTNLEYTWILQPGERHEHGRYVLGIGIPEDEDKVMSEEKTVNVSISIYSAVCRYWNETQEMWLTEGCWVASDSTISAVKCECNHLSFYGADLFVAPYGIDFAEDIKLFLNIADNPIMLATLASIFSLYLVCAFLAFRKDKRNAVKKEVIVLNDSDPLARVSYQVTVFTGFRQGAGTTATVTLTLCGTWGESESHVLNPADADRKVLHRGNIDSFILRTDRYLGNLTSIRLWHDNYGTSPDWFVSRVVVQSLETGMQWYFLCKSWISMQSGSIDRVFLVATPEELSSFQHLFVTKTVTDFRDGHLWFSVFSRPAQSQFTCLQRVSCCLSLLFCTMLTGLMFYGVTIDPTEEEIDFGHFRMTISEIIIGIESGLITMPINIAIVQIFRNVRSRVSRDSWNQHLRDIKTLCTGAAGKGKIKQAEMGKNNKDGDSSGSDDGSCLTNMDRNDRGQTTEHQSLHSQRWEDKPSEGGQHDKLKQKDDSLDEVGKAERLSPDVNSEVDVENISVTRISSIDSRSSALQSLVRKGHKVLVYEKLTEALQRLEDIPPSEFQSKLDYEMTKWKLKRMISLQTLYMNSSVKFYDKGKVIVGNYITKRQVGVLPWWFLYVGWTLVTLTALGSAFFILWYGLKYGRQKSIDWLVSMAVSLFQSVFCVQPIKVVLLAMILSSLFGKSDDQVGVEADKSKYGDSALLQGDIKKRRSKTDLMRQAPQYHPPSNSVIRKALKERERQQRVSALVKELIGSLVLLYLVTTISYNLVSHNAIHMNNALDNTFAEGFDEIGSYIDIFSWLNDTLLPEAYIQKDIYAESGYGLIELMGTIRLRQVRIKPDSCKVHKSLKSKIANCQVKYSSDQEDRRLYTDSWSHSVSLPFNESSKWHYQTPSQAKGSFFMGQLTAYGRGGYVADLGATLQEAGRVLQDVFDTSWVDVNSRALFVELTVYNGDADLISVITYLIELPAIGGVLLSHEMVTTKYYKQELMTNIYIIVSQIAYVLVTMYFLFTMMIGVYHERSKYFYNIWNLINTLVVLLSLAAIAVYIYHLANSTNAIARYKANQQSFTSFHNVAFSHQVLNIITGSIVFVATIKLAKLLRTNSSIYLVHRTFQAAKAHLISYSIILGYTIFTFCLFSYLVFGRKIPEYNNILHASESLLGFLLGEFDLFELFEQYPIIGPTFFSIIIFSVYFILMPVFTMLMISAFLQTSRSRTHSEDSDTFLILLSQLTCGKLVKVNTNDDVSMESSELDDSV
ncbi:polycystin-1-like protein 2 isoform X2 [Ptychodera flava]|uniref:polycystin-1-like protein 2 isoform X2 n=1 Tax=Ptychodera flava TaxID=63121 RepID=UPI00396A9F68